MHLDANDIVMEPFKPGAWYHASMDDIIVIVEEVSLVTKWHGFIHVESMVQHVIPKESHPESIVHDEVFKGFRLTGVHHLLTSVKLVTFVPHLLMRAYHLDAANIERKCSYTELRCVYRAALQLLRRYPETRWLKFT